MVLKLSLHHEKLFEVVNVVPITLDWNKHHFNICDVYYIIV